MNEEIIKLIYKKLIQIDKSDEIIEMLDFFKNSKPSEYKEAARRVDLATKPTSENLLLENDIKLSELTYTKDYISPYISALKLDGYSTKGIEAILKSTTNILSALKEHNKGLVFGQVQSGKTSNFIALSLKALSTDFDRVIILAGMNDNLRLQTQCRLETFTYGKSPVYSETMDVSNQYFDLYKAYKNNEDILFGTNDKDINHVDFKINLARSKQIFVIKKNKSSLTEMRSQILNDGIKTLIIDDEADSGSINTSKDKEIEKSKFNRLINEMVHHNENIKFVAYTATPFANLLISKNNNADNIAPDFLQYITPGRKYKGMKEYFMQSDDSNESPAKVYPFDGFHIRKNTDISSIDFSELILAFLVDYIYKKNESKICKGALGINISHINKEQKAIKKGFLSWVEVLKTGMINFERGNKTNFKDTLDSVVAKLNYPKHKLSNLFSQIKSLLDILSDKENFNIINKDNNKINSSAEVYVVAGGYKLGRGITLDNLTMFCIDRTSKEYDVIMQQARFFGYRKLNPTIFISHDNWEKFISITHATQDLIQQVIGNTEKHLNIKNIFIKQVMKYKITNPTKIGLKEIGYHFDTNILGHSFPFIKTKDHNDNDSIISELISNLSISSETAYGKGIIFDISTYNMIQLLNKLKFKGLNSEFIYELDKLLSVKKIDKGYIFIPFGTKGEKEYTIEKLSHLPMRRGKIIKNSKNIITTNYSVKQTDYKGLHMYPGTWDFAKQRDANDFVISFYKVIDVEGESPFFMGMSIGGGEIGGSKEKISLGYKTNMVKAEVINK